jgi:hypothetical protein
VKPLITRLLRQIPLPEKKYVQFVTAKGQLHQTAWHFCNTSTSNVQCFSLDTCIQLIKQAVGQVVVQSKIFYVENTCKKRGITWKQIILQQPKSHTCSWFQTFSMFWMFYAFFWVIHWLLKFMCQCFGTLCPIFIGT